LLAADIAAKYQISLAVGVEFILNVIDPRELPETVDVEADGDKVRLLEANVELVRAEVPSARDFKCHATPVGMENSKLETELEVA